MKNPYWLTNICGGELSTGQKIIWCETEREAVEMAVAINGHEFAKRSPHAYVYYINSVSLVSLMQKHNIITTSNLTVSPR